MPLPALSTSRRPRHFLAAALLLALPALPVAAQQYTWSTGPVSAHAPDGVAQPLARWQFLDVYCVDFPHDAPATGVTRGLMNGDAISFYQADHPDGLHSYIVTSTLPPGRSAAQDLAAQRDNERRNAAVIAEAASADRYQVQTRPSDWGEVVSLDLVNVGQADGNGPFPLTRPLMHAAQPLHSQSSHRIFSRGNNRFEVAVLDQAPQAAASPSRAAALADQLMHGLQACTSAMDTPASR